MAPRIVKLLKGNKRKNNQGPIAPISRKDVERAGSLEEVYKGRSRYDPFAQEVSKRIKRVGRPKIGKKEE